MKKFWDRGNPAPSPLDDGFNGALGPRSNCYDVIQGSIFDSFALSAGGTFTRQNSQLFSYVGPASGKTAADTNMELAQRLSAPMMASITRIVFTFAHYCDPRDVLHIAENACWFFRLGRKYYSSGVMLSMQQSKNTIDPIRTCSYCAAVYVNHESCPGCGSREFRLPDIEGEPGVIAGGRQFYLELPDSMAHIIQYQQQFNMTFDLHDYTVLGRFKLWCHLEGKIARGVQ